MSGPQPLPPPLPKRVRHLGVAVPLHELSPAPPPRHHPRSQLWGWLLLAVGCLAGAAAIGLNAGRSPATAVTAQSSASATTGPPRTTVAPLQRAPGEPGTIESPVPLGRYGQTGEGWNMRVNWIDFDADDDVLAASRRNDPLDPGRSYVVANVTVVYKGTSPQTAPPLGIGYFGGVTETPVWTFTDPAGYTSAPDPDLLLSNDIIPGAQVTGNVVFSMADEDLTSLLVIATPYGRFKNEQYTYFASTS